MSKYSKSDADRTNSEIADEFKRLAEVIGHSNSKDPIVSVSDMDYRVSDVGYKVQSENKNPEDRPIDESLYNLLRSIFKE